MAKHDRAKQEKRQRNALYALRYKQRKCRDRGHRSSRRGKRCLCGGEMSSRACAALRLRDELVAPRTRAVEVTFSAD